MTKDGCSWFGYGIPMRNRTCSKRASLQIHKTRLQVKKLCQLYFHQCQLYRVRQNKVFSATVWNFNLKFYRLILWNVLHLTAKWNVILLKNKEVIDFLTWPPTDFSALKMFKLKCYLIFKIRLPDYCWWRHSDALINSNLFCL